MGLQEGRTDTGGVGGSRRTTEAPQVCSLHSLPPTLLSPSVLWGPLEASFFPGVQGQQVPAATPEGRPFVRLEATPPGDRQCRSAGLQVESGAVARVPLCRWVLGEQGSSAPASTRLCRAAESVTVRGAGTWPAGKATLGH